MVKNISQLESTLGHKKIVVEKNIIDKNIFTYILKTKLA